MKILVNALVLLLFLPAYNNSSAQASPQKLYLNFSLTPGVGYRILTNSSGNPNNEAIIDYRNEYEKPIFSPGVQFTAGYYFKNFIGVEGGIAYAMQGYTSKWRDTCFLPCLPGSCINAATGWDFPWCLNSVSGYCPLQIRLLAPISGRPD